jgi:3-phosphoshikimate 1-carboxyvinyltransferase
MHEELSKMGADIEELPDGLIVRQSRLKGAVVNGHDDHRVVMALAIAAMMADGETVIETAQAANVTYPGFVNDFRNIGADITILD